MNQKKIRFKIFFYIFLVSCFMYKPAVSQQYDCNFKPPVITIDFGTSNNKKDIDLSSLSNYNRVDDDCPNDGNYSFATRTNSCFMENWNTLLEDHTPNDIGGRMMVINASMDPGTFFSNFISGLKQGITYEFSVWLINICWGSVGCDPVSPEIAISISSGVNLIARFETGPIEPSVEPKWKKYYGTFTVPPGANVVAIKMDDLINGGCGNDFAVDDILIKECVEQKPPIVATPARVKAKPVVEKPVTKPTLPPPVAKESNLPMNNLKKTNPIILNEPGANKPAGTPAVSLEKLPAMILPTPIATRDNPVIKRIETPETEMLIELYDNGEIDGDTVTIYHNNQLLVSHAGISEKPITLRIKVDKEHPHHELIMVADNLGSIPPNTSLMVITANNKRYEIFISSTEQKNAKIIIDLKE